MDRNKYYGAESASLSPLEEVCVCGLPTGNVVVVGGVRVCMCML